jgi:putative transposase
MPRRLRIEYEGAIYHVTARAGGRQKMVRDDLDRRRLIDGLEQTVTRCGWELLAYVIMDTRLHLLLKTPRPNLSAGMHSFLSGYAIRAAQRRRLSGQVFQGRYRTEMIEDQSHYWAVSRYIHLLPVRARRVAKPEQWPWSSYPGYHHRAQRRRQAWVAHDALLAAWQGDPPGKDATSAYTRFVEAGVKEPPASPFREAISGWILGSDRFVAQIRRRSRTVVSRSRTSKASSLAAGLDPDLIFAAVAEFYGLDASSFSRRYEASLPRAVVAWLCRRHTEITLRALAERLGLSRPDSVPNLPRRLEAQLKKSPRLAADLEKIMQNVRARSAAPPPAAPSPPGIPRKDAKAGKAVRKTGEKV